MHIIVKSVSGVTLTRRDRYNRAVIFKLEIRVMSGISLLAPPVDTLFQMTCTINLVSVCKHPPGDGWAGLVIILRRRADYVL